MSHSDRCHLAAKTVKTLASLVRLCFGWRQSKLSGGRFSPGSIYNNQVYIKIAPQPKYKGESNMLVFLCLLCWQVDRLNSEQFPLDSFTIDIYTLSTFIFRSLLCQGSVTYWTPELRAWNNRPLDGKFGLIYAPTGTWRLDDDDDVKLSEKGETIPLTVPAP